MERRGVSTAFDMPSDDMVHHLRKLVGFGPVSTGDADSQVQALCHMNSCKRILQKKQDLLERRIRVDKVTQSLVRKAHPEDGGGVGTTF